MKDKPAEVLVIGGGPAGLAAAIAARRRGLAVTVADAMRPPIDKACGEGIMPDGIAAARAIGIDVPSFGGFRFRGIRFRLPDRSVEAAFPSGEGVALRRTVLHQGMVECAERAGVTLEWGACVTGLTHDGAVVNGRVMRADWIVGADGGDSRVRQWAGLNDLRRDSRRYGFRRHYAVEPWTDFVEIHWGEACQLYLTPVGARELCAVAISRDPHLRLEEALAQIPAVAERLGTAAHSSSERGGLSAMRRLRRVARARVALVGDASGSVDAITGDGMYLLFRQAAVLADSLAAGSLAPYEAAHRRIRRRPEWMGDLMLLLGRHRRLRRRAIGAMARDPRLFQGMLAMHVGDVSVAEFLANGAALGRRMLWV